MVKELLENAIDAQSNQIHIEIERGGSALIRISDDGTGINKDDLALAVTRHATSKLQTLTELEKIMSLGFRGEALASISAVSKLSIKSKQADQEQAWMINTGTDSDFADYTAEVEPVAHSQGTTIDVRELFFNTPARRKFMRTVKTEFKHIDDIVKRIALSQFDIAFKLTHNKKLLRNLPRAVTEKAIMQRISKLFSPEFLSHAKKVEFSSDHFSNMGTLRLWGWVSAPQWHRKQADWQYFYVNGRYIKDKLVNHALRQAYQEYLPEDTFSAYLLYLEIDPQQVDVNVHPTKHEVRFRQSRLIHDFIYSALKQALFPEPVSFVREIEAGMETESLTSAGQAGQSPKTSVQEGEYVNQYRHVNSHQLMNKSHQLMNKSYQPKIQSSLNQHRIAEQLDGLKQLYNTEKVESSQHTNLKIETQLQANEAISSFFGRSIGCLIPNYLMSQTITNKRNAQIFVIHILRAQQYLLKQLFQPNQQVPLLIPETVSLSNSEIDFLLQYQTDLNHWGLELNQLGNDTLMVRSLPSLHGIPGCTIDTETFIKRILKNIKDSSFAESSSCAEGSSSADQSELIEAFINSIRSAALSQSEQESLLKMLSEQVHQSGIAQASMRQYAVWKILDELTLDHLF